LREEMANAFRLHRAGELTLAASLYQTILSRDPEQADALQWLGALRQQQGQFAEAVELCRKAVALRPGAAANHLNLAEAYRALGRAREALPHCRRSIALQPSLPEAHNRLGETFRALGRFNEAIASYVEALRLNPQLAQVHANVGIALRQDGRHQESLSWFRRATELDPKTRAFRGYLTDALTDLDMYPEAIESYEKMIAVEPNRADFHSTLGWLLQREGKYDLARERYERALVLRPEFPDAQIGLGGVMEELGLMAEADAWFRMALESDPANTTAIARLPRPQSFHISAQDLGLLERRIADPSVAETARAPMLFALANVLDARRRYAEATVCMRRANAAASAENEKRSRQYKPADHERFITNMIASFPPEFFARFAGAGLETRRPVFIFGLPRSGTSLIEQILASHSQLHGAGELNQGRLDFEAIPVLLNRTDTPLAYLPDLTAKILRIVAGRHEARLLELGGGAPRVADKMTDNYLYLGLLAILFPNATFIHSRRDLRDVAVSCWITSFRGLRWTNEPQHLADRFAQYLRLMAHWRTVLPSPIHEVDYEETVDDFEVVARRLIAACGLEWEPACLDFHQSERPVKTASFAQVRQPVYKKSVARWKNYEHELRDLFSALPIITSADNDQEG
jgi:tetratricopeptide (TPR) repeat protein